MLFIPFPKLEGMPFQPLSGVAVGAFSSQVDWPAVLRRLPCPCHIIDFGPGGLKGIGHLTAHQLPSASVYVAAYGVELAASSASGENGLPGRYEAEAMGRPSAAPMAAEGLSQGDPHGQGVSLDVILQVCIDRLRPPPSLGEAGTTWEPKNFLPQHCGPEK